MDVGNSFGKINNFFHKLYFELWLWTFQEFELLRGLPVFKQCSENFQIGRKWVFRHSKKFKFPLLGIESILKI